MLEKILSKADSGDKTRIDCRYPAGSFLFKLKLELKTSIQIVTCFEYQSTTCIRNRTLLSEIKHLSDKSY